MLIGGGHVHELLIWYSMFEMDDLQHLARNHTVGLKVIGSKLILFGMDVDIAKAKVDIKRFLRTCHSARWSSGKDDHNLDLDSISGYVEDAYQHNKRYTLFTNESNRLYRLKIKEGKVSICQHPVKREIQLQRRGEFGDNYVWPLCTQLYQKRYKSSLLL